MLPADVRDLVAKPGASREVHLAQAVEGLRTPVVEADTDPVRMDLMLESIVEGILVTGPVSGRMTLRCARCLTEFGDDFRVEVAELFAEDIEEADESYPLRDGMIDLEPMVRDAVVLSMPFSPLCRTDCLGLCERCGGDRNRGECTCGPQMDPRWSALEAFDTDLRVD